MNKKFNEKEKKRFHKLLILPIILIIILTSVIIIVINTNYRNGKVQYKTELIHTLEDKYHSVLTNYADFTRGIFEIYLNNPNIIKLVEKGNSEKSSIKNNSRRKLQDKLMPVYNKLKNFGIRQFHFHLPNYESFLRLHKPKKFGDNLEEVRYSVVKANDDTVEVHGFEEGRIYNGFRNVYPISFKGKHVGSVEISACFCVLKRKLTKQFPGDFAFLIKTDVVSDKVFESEQDFYRKSDLSPEYLYESRATPDSSIVQINSNLKDEIAPKLKRGESFLVRSKNKKDSAVVVFVPINNVKGEHVAYMVSYQKDKILSQFDADHNENIILMIVLALVVLVITIQLIRYYLQNKISQEQLKKTRDFFKHEALHDPLTGIMNRRAMLDETSREIARSKRSNMPLYLCMLDIDHFKLVNDAHGHQVGDEVLKGMVNKVVSILRIYDHFGRYGGEEFIIITPNIKEKQAREMFNRIRAEIENNSIQTSAGKISITISLGITCMQEDAKKMVEFADEAMYQAKENGRNQIVFHQS